ncbi:MAG: GNAT family N-acetyltransferase [Candidatus Taylorbacteria bacterium]|nr:GNAT family N-acetyltransferase [Candidatus Taylorbacteria bacterium]
MGNDEVKIRKISSLDDEIFSLLTRSFPEVSWNRDNLAQFINSDSAILLLAGKGNEGCGLLRAHILYRYDKKNPEIFLHEIDVNADYQRQGIGSALIERLKEIAKEINASEIWVIANRSNQGAMHLYAKANMRETHDDDVVLQFDF